ncbi:MAG: FAD-dependent monooxygenase [Chloroflexota bacterium]
MKYDLAIVGAGPAGLMAARTAARDGLKVLLVERKRDVTRVRRYCTRNLHIGPGGFRSDKTFDDVKLNRVNLAFEIDHGKCKIRLKNLDDAIDFDGYLGAYYGETWVSPSGYAFHREKPGENITAFHIDKEALLSCLLKDATASGCQLMADTTCERIEDTPAGVTLNLTSGGKTEVVQTARTIVADGGFSTLIEQLGFNQGRPPGAPQLKYLCYILDRIDSPYPDGTSLHLTIPSMHRGFVNVGLWAGNRFQISCSTSLVSDTDLPSILEKAMKSSPFASWFARSKIVDRQGCNQELRPPVRETARGNTICIGDNVAYAETAIKGALGCGYVAAKSTGTALAGQNGNTQYNDYWQHAFNFFSPKYSAWGKQMQPVARVLDDNEIDALYKWINDNGFYGLPFDTLPDNRQKFTAELPKIAEKVFAAGGRPGGRPAAD